MWFGLSSCGSDSGPLPQPQPTPLPQAVCGNGLEVVQRVTAAAGFQLTQLRVPIARSSWIAARSRSVLTRAIYVIVGGQPVRASAADACCLRRSVDDLTALVTSGRLRLVEGRDPALQAYGAAAAELQRRFVESGGGVCG